MAVNIEGRTIVLGPGQSGLCTLDRGSWWCGTACDGHVWRPCQTVFPADPFPPQQVAFTACGRALSFNGTWGILSVVPGTTGNIELQVLIAGVALPGLYFTFPVSFSKFSDLVTMRWLPWTNCLGLDPGWSVQYLMTNNTNRTEQLWTDLNVDVGTGCSQYPDNDNNFTPTLITTASPVVGGTIHDTAILSGGSSPTGVINFELFGPDDDLCTGTPIFTSSVVVSGNGSYNSSAYTPTLPGTYRWMASYSGDSWNKPVFTDCNAVGESVVYENQLFPFVTLIGAN